LHNVERGKRAANPPRRVQKPVKQIPFINTSAPRGLIERSGWRQRNEIDAATPKIIHPEWEQRQPGCLCGIRASRDTQPLDILARDVGVGTNVDNVNSRLLAKVVNCSRNQATRPERLAQSDFIRDEKPSCRIWSVEPLECVVGL
jgi:hypothetical protein